METNLSLEFPIGPHPFWTYLTGPLLLLDVCLGWPTGSPQDMPAPTQAPRTPSPYTNWVSSGMLTSPTYLLIKRLHYLLPLIGTFIGWMNSTPPAGNSRYDGSGTPWSFHPLTWHAIPLSSWDINSGTPSPDSRAYQLFHLAHSPLPLLNSQGGSPSFRAVITLPIASPVRRASINNLFSSPWYLPNNPLK